MNLLILNHRRKKISSPREGIPGPNQAGLELSEKEIFGMDLNHVYNNTG